MTEQTITKLIAEARVIWEADDLHPGQMIPRLVMALEAADQRADLAEADLDVELDKNAAYRAKNDQLAAVVEKVRQWAEEATGCGEPSGDTVSDLIADALREREAGLK